jgi:predicted GNAT family acetyltransferase
MNMTDSVQDNPAESRFELNVDGHLAAAYYELSDGTITFTHTEVPKELGGRGIGSQLAKAALDQARAKGLKVVAQCPFVNGYIGKHAEYADLLK